MQLKLFALAGLASSAVAQQGQSLVQALNSSTDLSQLFGILGQQPQLVATLGNLTNITLLAPSNAAISAFLNSSAAQAATANPALLQAVLTYHVLNGSYSSLPSNATFVRTALQPGQFANVTGGQRVEVMNTTAYSGLKARSNITSAPINFTGGYIHVIDSVLTLPQSVSLTATAFNLTSFYGAINATNLINTVNGVANSTFFVPNNAAFQNIGSAVPNLTTEQLTGILAYHVVNGTVAYSTTLMNMSVPTFGGGSLNISVHNASTVFVNNARVIIPDILVANGVVHIIDQVLNPNNTAGAAAGATAGAPAYSGASSATGAPFTSGQPTPTSTINTASIQATAANPSSASSSGAAWIPRPTGAVGAALGGLALLMQL